MRRWILGSVLVLVLAIGAYVLLFSGSTVTPTLTVVLPTSVIGSGEDAIAVTPDGQLLLEAPPPKDGSLPALPLSAPPKNGRLEGPMLEQAKVLGAAPAPLRPCIAGSRYGESGVDVELHSGIELRFGDAARAAEKWRAAATVFADPSITALDYVDLHSPRRPTVGGSGYVLPGAEEASGSGCGE